MNGVSIGSSNRGYHPPTIEDNMTRTGRILSRDAEKWFGDKYSVTIGSGGFTILNRSNRTCVTRRKYIGVLQYAKNQHVQHCRRELDKEGT